MMGEKYFNASLTIHKRQRARLLFATTEKYRYRFLDGFWHMFQTCRYSSTIWEAIIG
jgi:hypothetical protein